MYTTILEGYTVLVFEAGVHLEKLSRGAKVDGLKVWGGGGITSLVPHTSCSVCKFQGVGGEI